MSRLPNTVGTIRNDSVPSKRIASTLNHRQARYVAARLKGESETSARRIAGFPDWLRGSRSIEDEPVVAAAIAESTALLAEAALVGGLIDAA